MFFISLQNIFPFFRKSNFSILHFQISWRYQMPKHKTRNTFHWITWEVNTICSWNLASLCNPVKEKILSKNSEETAVWKLVPGPFVFAKNYKHSFYWKMKFLKKATYVRYVIAKLSKFSQISMLTSLDSFLQRILWKLN